MVGRGQAAPSSNLRLAELLAALSLATDLANAFPTEKALRNCLLALLLGRELGLSAQELSDVYYFALLRSVGCTSFAYEEARITGDDRQFRNSFAGVDSAEAASMLWRAFSRLGAGSGLPARARAVSGFLASAPSMAPAMAGANCEAGARLAEHLGMSRQVCDALTQVYERWDGKGLPAGLPGERLSVAARVGILAHDVTALPPGMAHEEVRAMVRRRSGGEHDPVVAAAFLSRSDELLQTIESESVWDAVLDAEPEPRPWLPSSRIDQLARAFAYFSDLKSPYTLGHSIGVAALAERAGSLSGLGETDLTALRRGALMHDLGRVSVSNGIWDKPGRLTSAEWERVRLHPYYSERILERSSTLRPLARLSGSHHERLDGSGYHRGDSAAALAPTARILAAADAYHAMTEARPHRDGLRTDPASLQLRREVESGRLDRDAVAAVMEAAGLPAILPKRHWPADLTDREIAVLRLAVRGRHNRQIASALFISEDTVRTHIRHVYEKTALSSRAGLALFAMENDLVGLAGSEEITRSGDGSAGVRH